MKYDVEKLRQIKEETASLKGPYGNELNFLITRCIIIKQELEEVEKLLITPDSSKAENIAKHMQLIKEYKQNRDRQIALLPEICGNRQGISAGLAEDYQETVKTIKA